MTIIRSELEEGEYIYKMPEWKEPVSVILESDPNHTLVMRFNKLFQPVPLRDIPINAIMEKIS
jgi:hypothetical protein